MSVIDFIKKNTLQVNLFGVLEVVSTSYTLFVSGIIVQFQFKLGEHSVKEQLSKRFCLDIVVSSVASW